MPSHRNARATNPIPMLAKGDCREILSTSVDSIVSNSRIPEIFLFINILISLNESCACLLASVYTLLFLVFMSIDIFNVFWSEGVQFFIVYFFEFSIFQISSLCY